VAVAASRLILRIAARAEHADEAFRRRAGRFAELLETDRRLDVVAQDRLAGDVDAMPLNEILSRFV
jgi:hypothetical protein